MRRTKAKLFQSDENLAIDYFSCLNAPFIFHTWNLSGPSIFLFVIKEFREDSNEYLNHPAIWCARSNRWDSASASEGPERVPWQVWTLPKVDSPCLFRDGSVYILHSKFADFKGSEGKYSKLQHVMQSAIQLNRELKMSCPNSPISFLSKMTVWFPIQSRKSQRFGS